MVSTYVKPGDWNAVCSLCGRKRKASELVKNWQGMYRCPEHNEIRQPQDFVRGQQDIQTVPWSQRPTSFYVQVCTFNGLSAIPGYAIPGCSIPGNTALDQQTVQPVPAPPLPPIPPPPPPTPTIPANAMLDSTGTPMLDSYGNYMVSA